MKAAKQLFWGGIGLMAWAVIGIGAGVWLMLFGTRPGLIGIGAIVVVWNIVNLTAATRNTMAARELTRDWRDLEERAK